MILHLKYFPVHGSGSQDPLIWILFRVDPSSAFFYFDLYLIIQIEKKRKQITNSTSLFSLL